MADGLVDKMVQEQSLLLEWTGHMGRHTQQRLAWERERLAHLTQAMKLQPDQMLQAKAVQLGHLRERTMSLAQQALELRNSNNSLKSTADAHSVKTQKVEVSDRIQPVAQLLVDLVARALVNGRSQKMDGMNYKMSRL